ncbi:MAG: hypothetical protein OJJ54_19825 [Pseudonocardia sp.]|nr:hypothetical protein [Pseudonocardia sp.]
MTFIAEPAASPGTRALHAEDTAEVGYVMNTTRLWAHQPATHDALFELMKRQVDVLGLDLRRRGILVAACASALGDSYCSLAWGSRLAKAADEQVAAAVIRGTDEGLSPAEAATARWARAIARDPNGTTEADVRELREHGFDDAAIFAMTTFVALRLAFSTVNDALGARRDAALRTSAPPAVRDSVTFGRPVE